MTQILSSRSRGIIVRELVHELDTSEKTIRRDLETLRTVGFPIEEVAEEDNRKRRRLTNRGPP